MNFVSSLILTIIIEFIIYLIIIRKNFLWLFLFSMVINCFTNPLANLFFIIGLNLFIIELAVFLVEIFLIKYLFNVNYKKAVIISLIANLTTAFVGFLVPIVLI